ncbi:MAG: MGMT family protein [Elusimicrobia bacterium]|nr:MGMT family protein [Elusimicrobiota bacterium]
MAEDDRCARIYAAVRRVPKGRVATYGQIARLAGLPGRARLVGKALGALKDASVPWHRIVNAAGKISGRSEADSPREQRRRLEREGVRFTPAGRIDLEGYRFGAGADEGAESFRRFG